MPDGLALTAMPTPDALGAPHALETPDHPGARPPGATVQAACLNCGHGLGEPRPRYCPACGQETRLRPPTLLEFAQQFGGAYLSTEGALWRSLKLLVTQPGAITLAYLRGRRRHYVLPLRLYLTISLLVLLALRLVAQVNTQLPDAPAQGKLVNNLVINIGPGQAGVKEGVFFCTSLPDWLCQRLKRRLDLTPAALAAEVPALGERLIGHVGTAMFVLLPCFALWLKLLYWNRGLVYTEHLVFALHLHSLWFLLLALALTGWGLLVMLAMLATPTYGWLALRRVYGGRTWPRLLRSAVLALLQLVALSLVVTLLGVYTLLT